MLRRPASSRPYGERGIRLTEKNTRTPHRYRLGSLRLRMVLVLLAGILAAYVTCCTVDEIGYRLIERVYMSQSAQKQREQAMVEQLRLYVEEKDVSSTDAAALSGWCREKGYVYLSIYRDGSEILGTDGNYVTDTQLESYTGDVNVEQAQEKNQLSAANTYTGAQELPAATPELPAATPELPAATDAGTGTAEVTYGEEWFGTLYRIPFADGDAMVGLVEYSETRYYTILSTVSIAAGVAVLLGAVLLFAGSLTRRVTAMSRMVARVAAGELEATIAVRGTDEVAQLAADVDAMRGTIVERLHSEQAAWQANNQLITAISHDIRNPLTSLIGYADLLAAGQESDPERQRQYLAACRDKAYQLKALTDELFGYFVVFGSPKLSVQPEQLDLGILLEQLLGEAVFRLQSEGRTVEYTPLPVLSPVAATVDTALLKRLFDNLFSNIDKYADFSRPVTVHAAFGGGGVDITLKNAVAYRRWRTESSNIGLRTCKRIAQELSLTFVCKTEKTAEEECFTATVHIPAQTKSETE